MYQKAFILKIYRHLAVISFDMRHGIGSSDILIERRHFELWRNPHARNHPQISDVHTKHTFTLNNFETFLYLTDLATIILHTFSTVPRQLIHILKIKY